MILRPIYAFFDNTNFVATNAPVTSRTYSPNRRQFLQAGSAIATSHLLGCSSDGGACNNKSENWTYILEMLAIVAIDAVSIYFVGAPLVPLNSATSMQAGSRSMSGGSSPGCSDSTYSASSSAPSSMSDLSVIYSPSGDVIESSHGMAQPLKAVMPRNSMTRGKLAMDIQGTSWSARHNTADATIEHVELLADDGSSIIPGASGGVPLVSSQNLWLPYEDLYVTGLPNKRYPQLAYQTTTGKRGYLPLAI